MFFDEFFNVSENDMDFLIMEEFVCDEGFRKIFTDKANIKSCTVNSVYHSLSDSDGESDITFIVDVEGIKHGILIEDKINAVTMPKQSERYYERGEKGKQRGDYIDYRVLLVCPNEYWEQHQLDVNAQYECVVFYEELRDYLGTKGDLRSEYKKEIIEHALHKKKKGYQLFADESVTNFWRNMMQFCEMNYPSLYMSYDGQPKGSSSSWIYFKTSIEKMWVVYKSSPGEVVLEYHGANPNFSKENLKPYMERICHFAH